MRHQAARTDLVLRAVGASTLNPVGRVVDDVTVDERRRRAGDEERETTGEPGVDGPATERKVPPAVEDGLRPDEVLWLVRERYDDLVLHDSWGERGLYYNPDDTLPRGTYFLTLKDHDGEHDTASALDRPGVYRVSFGLDGETYAGLFGEPPTRPAAGVPVATGHDFAALDELLPHPTYAWGRWVCVLNPTSETLDDCWPLLDVAYERAKATFAERTN
jgi:hypothetical protein